MAAVLLYFCTAFVVQAAFLFTVSRSANYLCPSACSCLGSMVDCSKRGLIEIPKDLPHWVTILELQSNDINEIPDDAFKGLDKLEKLDLSNNQLTGINGSVFYNLPSIKELKLAYNHLSEIPYTTRISNLTHLIIHHNRIHTINREALDSFPRLRTLDLNFNKILELTPGTFPHSPYLHQLYLNNNKILHIEKGALDNLTSLEWLKLNKNKLQVLPKGLFSKLQMLKYLELNRNKFRVIEGLVFHGLGNLLVLKLRRNRISELMDGAFWGLEKIQNLQLDFNNLTSISKGWLYGLKSLQQLSLAHNHVQRIDEEGWRFCSKLWELDLTHNQVSIVTKNTFSELNSLQYLYLDHNRVSFIADGAFKHMSQLKILEMNFNEISWTIQDMNGAFSGLHTLTNLGLDSNRIKSIAKRAFQGLEQLRQLHMTDNAISSIQSNAFGNLERLQELRMNSSNLLCDCQLAWLPKWLTSAGFQNSINARCSHPEWLKGKSIFDIQANDFKCDDFPKPIILTEPDSQVVLKDSNVTLQCTAASSSKTPMTFQWKKDNVVLTRLNIENLATTSDGQITKYTTRLHIPKIQDADEGEYQCMIANHLGATFSQKAAITVHVFPTFTKTPEDVTVRAGTTARLECAARGQPDPEIAWQKDGGDDFPAARERRMHVMPTDDVFFIVDVRSSDQGTYSCTATNAAGTIVANATLNVLETPSFVKPMENKKTKEGETTVLECMAAGSPKPKLTWFKDDILLDVTSRHFFTADRQLLIITDTKASDSGIYTCEMSNTLGMERDSSHVRVISPKTPQAEYAGSLDNESTTTGIIIIAVVCCVVGTSLVWVIIIYQTRKKSDEYSSTPTDETTLPGEMPGTPYHSSDKDRSSSPGPLPPHSTSLSNYCGRGHGWDSALARGFSLPPSKVRTAAIFPSDVEDDDHRQSIPLTSDEQQPAEASDNSITALHRLPHSDSDTLNSSSPSTRSIHSSHNGSGLLQTFHPLPTNHNTPAQQPVTNEHSPNLVAIVHNNVPNRHSASFTNHGEDCRIPDGHHGSQPPGDNPGFGEEGVYDNLGRSTLPRRYWPAHSISTHSLRLPPPPLRESHTNSISHGTSSSPQEDYHQTNVANSQLSNHCHPCVYTNCHPHHYPYNTDISLANQSETDDDLPPTIPNGFSETCCNSTAHPSLPNRTFQV